jgi:hypothetical protein
VHRHDPRTSRFNAQLVTNASRPYQVPALVHMNGVLIRADAPLSFGTLAELEPVCQSLIKS